MASGSPGRPMLAAVFFAWPMKPSLTSATDGTPARSEAALTRNTAGVQLPQQPIPEMTASTSISLRRAGRPAITAVSSSPWVEPNVS
jgi:hypothetical protein